MVLVIQRKMNSVFRAVGASEMSFDIRDLAVYPDTSRVAEGMQSIWQRTSWGRDTPLDGVLMVDPVFLQELVKINGTSRFLMAVCSPEATLLNSC